MPTILIVDDLSTNRKYLMTLLGDQGHQLIEAANGREGLAAAAANRLDLVITDVLMPVMDGYEFVRQLRLNPETRRVPVLFYTAPYGEREARALALSSGLAYVLRKPAPAADLLKIVSGVLSGVSDELRPGDSQVSTARDREHLRLLTDRLSEQAGDLKTTNIRLRALINIGLELTSSRDADSLLDSVCAAAHDLFGASYVTLGILDPDAKTVKRLICHGTDAPCWISTGDEVPGILAKVVNERSPLRGDNPGGDPAALHLPADHPEVQTFLAAPVASADHVYGWICLVGNEGQGFTEDDEDMVTALSGQVGRVIALEDEIAQRRRAESALREERDRAQRYLDTADVMLLALDLEGRIRLVNRYACSILGWPADELLGRDWIDTCLPEGLRSEYRPLLQSLFKGDLPFNENPVLTKSGEERLVEWRNTVLRDEQGLAIGTLSSGTDVTQRRTLEEQRQQSQKMEAIGRLAGGVAHDFNNLLTVILGHCELLLADLDPADQRQYDIADIQTAAEGAARLTRQLLAFSRKELIAPTSLDLNEVVAGIRPMIARLIGEDIKIVLDQPRPASPVTADRGQMEQIILNLAVNARDAMPKGGTLTIEIADVEFDDAYARTHVAVTPGPYVALTVTDTGAGMTAQVLARLFEPFFTTKGVGQGTGLGLATVHGIVTQSGGSVVVDSEVGKGTSFKVYWPRAAAGVVVKAPQPLVMPPARGETVLVVDDADGIRELAKRLLQRNGYKVLLAANAEQALHQFQQASIDVVLTDVVMMGGSGPDLIRRLVAERPGFGVIYMSGYTDDAIARHGVLDPDVAFVHKPFTAESLARKVREVLTAVTASGQLLPLA